MTSAELSTRFDIELDAVASAAAPGFSDAEKSNLLIKAQNMLVQEFARVKNWSAIYTLVNTDSTDAILSITDYGTKATKIDVNTTFPNFGYYVSSRALITRTNPTITSQMVECDLVERDAVPKFIVSEGFNTPYFKHPKIFLEHGGFIYGEYVVAAPLLVILVDNYTSVVNDLFELTYVRIPADINITQGVTSTLPENLHDTLVTLAVQEAVKSIYVSKTPQTPKQ